MKHKIYEEWLVLSLYDELSGHEQVLLHEHLEGCEKCRKEKEVLSALHGTLAHRKLSFSQEPMLQKARRELRLQIAQKAVSPSTWDRIVGIVDELVRPRIQIAVRTVGILAVGVFLGYVLFQHPADGILSQPGFSTAAAVDAAEPQITNLRFIDRDPQTGRIERFPCHSLR